MQVDVQVFAAPEIIGQVDALSENRLKSDGGAAYLVGKTLR